jgi:uncharacterized phiE125 gp8 family phage protein
MMLIEDVPVADADLPLEAFKEHLRLGTGFATDTVQDGVLIGFLRAAMSAIEGRTAKALFRRDYTLTTEVWHGTAAEALPIGPVVTVNELAIVQVDSSEAIVDPSEYQLVAAQNFPVLRSTRGRLPTIPTYGIARIRFTAGFSPDWDGMPADLAQAVMLLASHYYEYRDETALGHGCMPFGVTSLIQRYRPLRLTPGALE